MDGFDLLNEKLDSIKEDLKEDIQTVTKLLESHVHICEKDMADHEGRIRDVEAFKNRLLGGIVAASAISGIISAVVVLLIERLLLKI